MEIEYRTGESALPAEAFVALAQRVWPRNYDTARIGAALTRTINIGAWAGNQLLRDGRVERSHDVTAGFAGRQTSA